MSSSLARTFSSPFHSKVAQGARKFMSLQASNASKNLTNEIQELFKERSVTRKRKKIVNEIIESERSYQHHLQLLISNFLIPIKVGGLIPKAAIEAIFGNIEGIYSVNLQLLELMETDDVASALYKLAPFMKLYSLYANNFERSNKTIEEQEKKNPDFVAFKESQETKDVMNGLKLRALLITPIQRIPRYKLLLETLLEKTTPDHPDYQKLHDACAEVSKVATHINECLRLHENFNKMLSIQNNLVGDGAPRILAPGRKFLREGMLSKVCERGGSKDRMFFLFNDILIYAKKESACTYSCRGVFPLINCLIEQVMGGTRGPSEGGALFKVICKGKTLLLYSTSKQNARSWVRDIKSAISELHTNLASLRRGDTDPFTPPDAALKRDSKLRRSRGAKELLKKSNALSPMQQLRSCASPKQDMLYPMRRDILPHLANSINEPYLDAYEEKSTLLQTCLTSAKKERNTKPRLRRLHLEESFAKSSEQTAAGYELRSRKRAHADSGRGRTKSPNRISAKAAENRGRFSQRLIDVQNSAKKLNLSPGCFGSAKRPRVTEDETYALNDENNGSFTENNQENDIIGANQDDKHLENHPLKLDFKVEPETNWEGQGRQLRKDTEFEMEATDGKKAARVQDGNEKEVAGSKIWSLTDDNEVFSKRKRKGIIYQAKSKVSKSRRKNRKLSSSQPYRKPTTCSQSDEAEINNENTSLLFGISGRFKQTNTPLRDHVITSSDATEKSQSSCVIM